MTETSEIETKKTKSIKKEEVLTGEDIDIEKQYNEKKKRWAEIVKELSNVKIIYDKLNLEKDEILKEFDALMDKKNKINVEQHVFKLEANANTSGNSIIHVDNSDSDSDSESKTKSLKISKSMVKTTKGETKLLKLSKDDSDEDSN